MKKILLVLGILGVLFTGCSEQKGEKTQKDTKIEEEQSAEKQIVEKYKKYGVDEAYIAPYAKGIDVELITRDKKMSKETFNKVAKEIADQVRKVKNVDIKIGVSYLYQSSEEENSVTVYSGKY